MGYLISLSVTMGLNMPIQYLLNSATAVVLSILHQVLTSLKQMVKLKGQYVQTIKNLPKKAQDPYKALLNCRNTSLDGIKLSSVQLLMGRGLKTSLPTKVDLLEPQRSQEIQQHFQKGKEREKSYYYQHSGKEFPPPLNSRRQGVYAS